MDVKGHSGEVSDGNEEHVIGNCRKGSLWYKVAKYLCVSVLWKVKLVKDETRYFS